MKIRPLCYPVLFLSVSFLGGCAGMIIQNQVADDLKEPRYQDRAHTVYIKTPMIVPQDVQNRFQTDENCLPFGSVSDYRLIFDDLNPNYTEYNLKLIHCNADWLPSELNDLEFLESHNEFEFYNYLYSINTKTPYIQYSVDLPVVKIPGNYVLFVYEGSDREMPVLTRRLIAYDRRTPMKVRVTPPSDLKKRFTHHRINFKINYEGIKTDMPHLDFKVILRQNKRWDNAITNLRPHQIDELNKILDFDFFDLNSEFPAMKEFRYFDGRSHLFHGRRVIAHHKGEDGLVHLYVDTDKVRNGRGYLEWQDMNGGYFIENLHPGASEGEEDYFYVHFTLKPDQVIPNPVYVTGGFCQWQMDSTNLLRFLPDKNVYVAKIFMKQGFYDYQYFTTGSDDPYELEGTSYEAGNEYEILLYKRNRMKNYDELVGYSSHQVKF